MKNKTPNPWGRKCLWLATAALPLLGIAGYSQNVLQPSDPIIASSANSPGSEGVKNAIDGTQAKYLNFDSATGTSGFIVTPQVGPTWVTGLAMESANDAPERDPKLVTLEGSNDDGANYSTTNWTLIATINVPAYTARFQWQTFTFSNFSPFKSYRWTVVQCQGPGQNSMQTAEVQLLGQAVPNNVVVPSDPIIASSANSPGSEGVKNAIDGTQAKYLNFDSATGTSGFVVTPSVGATVAQGVAMESANDAPERDPKVVTLEGSNDAVADYTTGTWTLIATINVPAYTARFQWQTFLFPNVTPYLHYRWTVVQCQGPGQNSMQTAEVQILGTSAPANVILPSDAIIASSANSPGSEGVKNAIDGTQSKYLNFDSATGTSGFVVTPSVGATTITGLGMESANDAPERDPKLVTIEGSSDAVADYTTTNWTLITTINVPAYTSRFQWQYFYFPNSTPYLHFRWTVVQCQGPGQNSMQIAEVQLLAVTAKADCSKAAFVSTPINTPVLSGSAADLFVAVNGPWPVQWYTNGVAIPGATKATFTTDPITAANAGLDYTVAIVGCQTSPPVHTLIFTPSTTKSIGIQFAGGGANGTPTYIRTNDIVGVQQQAFWNSAVGSTGFSTNDPMSSTVTNGLGNADVLTDSDGNTNAISFSYATSGTWGAGVNAQEPLGRELNGLVGARLGNAADQVLTFHNVPAGSHAILIYSISPPLQIERVKFAITNQNMVVYQRTLNSDEYKPAPGFYRSTSTNASTPSIGNFVRFDGVHPEANGDINVVFNILDNQDRESGVNAIQLVLNAPNPGSPPVITQQPQPTTAPANGTAILSVTATGNGLTYQWRKNGANISNFGHVSGAQSDTLTISPFTAADEGVYSVAVFNQAGSTISDNAAAHISNFNIKDQLAVYFKFDETTGTNAANSASNGLPATQLQGNLTWGPGQVAGAAVFDGQTTLFVSNYTKASPAIAGSVWVNIPAAAAQADMVIFRNQEGDFQFGGTANRILGQFELIITRDTTTGNMYPSAVVSLGNNYARATGGTPFPFDAWHNVVFSADGAQLSLYVDSTNVASVDYAGNINVPNTPWISIGSRVATQTDTNAIPPLYFLDSSNPSLLTGSVDELALWTRSLTASEIAGIYQAGSTNKPLDSVIESLPATPATLTTSLSAGKLTISWTPTGGHLLSSPTLGTGANWTSLSTTNPTVVPITGAEQFFRVVNP